MATPSRLAACYASCACSAPISFGSAELTLKGVFVYCAQVRQNDTVDRAQDPREAKYSVDMRFIERYFWRDKRCTRLLDYWT